MIGFAVLRPEFLILLVLVPALVVAWLRWPPPLTTARSRLVLASRVLLVTLLVLALAGLWLTTQPNKRALVAVVDVSASVKADGNLDTEASAVKTLQARKGPDDLFGVVPDGHPLPQRLVRHGHWPRGWYPMRRGATPSLARMLRVGLPLIAKRRHAPRSPPPCTSTSIRTH